MPTQADQIKMQNSNPNFTKSSFQGPQKHGQKVLDSLGLFSSARRISLFFLFDYIKNNQMSFEDVEIGNNVTTPAKTKIKGVIVLTDNRNNISNDKGALSDWRCSGYKETEVDPLQFATGLPSYSHDDDIIAELTRRVIMLEEKVEALSKFQVASRSGGDSTGSDQSKVSKKKNRRKFKELVRDNLCPHCQKVYGSETALKCHLKLKHSSTSNHSQVQ